MFTWSRLQGEVGRWVKKNFPDSPAKHQVWGLIEELGELTHATLKGEQGIRGSSDEHIAKAKDAVADSVIFFMSACTLNGWDAAAVLRTSSPTEFQATFAVPQGRSTITHTLVGLSNMVQQLEIAEQESAELRELTIGHAKASALTYVSGLAAHCTQMGWSLQDILEEVWPRVRQRDWTKNKVNGGDLDAPAAREGLTIDEIEERAEKG